MKGRLKRIHLNEFAATEQLNLRERIDELTRLPVVSHTGEVVPLNLLAKMKTTWGPGAINSEDARLFIVLRDAEGAQTWQELRPEASP